MAEPKCPECGIAGTEHITSAPSTELSRERRPWFYIAHCDSCGYVYGIFTKHIFGNSGPKLIVENKR